MLEAYIDESFNEDAFSPRVFVVAGWIGERQVWRDLEQRWKAVLETEPTIGEFKSSDCLSQRREYEGWNQERADAFRLLFLRVIRESRIDAVTTTLEVEGPPGDSKRMSLKRSDYNVAVLHCMIRLASVSETYPNDEQISFICDARQKGRRDVDTLFRQLIHADVSFSSRLAQVGCGSSRIIIPLQAADLLAHEAYRHRMDLHHGRPRRTAFTEWLRPKVRRFEMLVWQHGGKFKFLQSLEDEHGRIIRPRPEISASSTHEDETA